MVTVGIDVTKSHAGWHGSGEVTEISTDGVKLSGSGYPKFDTMDGLPQSGTIFIKYSQKWDLIRIEKILEHSSRTVQYDKLETVYEFVRYL